MKRFNTLILLGLLVCVCGWTNAALVHQYTFNTDGQAEDSVGTADLTINGNAAVVGKSLVLPGGGTRTHNASAGGSALTELAATMNGTDELTIEVWFTQSAAQNWTKLFMAGEGANDNYMDLTPRRGNSGNVASGSYRTSGGESIAISGTVVPNHVEYYMAGVWNDTTGELSVYIAKVGDAGSWDAVTVGTSHDLAALNVNEFYLGSAVQFGDGDYRGQINEFRIYDTALTEAELQTSFAAGPATDIATDPTPNDGVDGVAIESQLSWVAPTAYIPSGYDVYFGTEPNSLNAGYDMEKIVDGLNVLTADPADHSMLTDDMDNEVTYFWRVDSIDPNTGGSPVVYTGDSWSFTTIPAVPFFSGQPAAQDLPEGSDATFSVIVESTSDVTSFVWYKDGVASPLADDGDYDIVSDALTSTLTILDVELADAGQYYCVAINAAGAGTSEMGELIVRSLVAHWTFDEGTGTTAVDSINGIGCDLVADANWITAGQVNGAMTLDGDGDMLTLDGSGNTSVIPIGSQAYTITAWIRPTALSPDRGIIGWGNYGGGRQVNAFKVINDDLVNYWWGADLAVNLGDEIDLADGAWHQVAVTFDGTARELFVDGESVGGDEPGTNNVPNLDNFAIGRTCTFCGGGEFFVGDIDEVRIYDYGLTNLDIAKVYVEENPAGTPCVQVPAFDLTGDCRVDLDDLLIVVNGWLDCGLIPQSACQ